MVLLERIELSASPLPRECSTTELQQHETGHGAREGAPMDKGGGRVKGIALTKAYGHAQP